MPNALLKVVEDGNLKGSCNNDGCRYIFEKGCYHEKNVPLSVLDSTAPVRCPAGMFVRLGKEDKERKGRSVTEYYYALAYEKPK